MSDKLKIMKELVTKLNNAARTYYQENQEVISNYEYDKLYDELLALEKETGTVFTNSPSVKVGYEALGELPKERHEFPMLSLDKTKELSQLKSWLGKNKGVLSWKLDGLTIVLTYQGGELVKAVTRGNGEIGEIITNNAKVFKNIPRKISYKDELILRGEAVIKYSDFNKINEQIADIAAKYKNPRNLCSGSVRQLNNEITAKRNVYFFVFSLVKAQNVDFENSKINQCLWLEKLGFDVVAYAVVNEDNIEEIVSKFAGHIPDNDVPSDGLVLTFDDIRYGVSLGTTAKFPRDSIAFKWADEIKETKLLEIEWSASRTGLINPVAIFEPVELEGTTVTRASVHNLSIVEELALGIGDEIEVYKANMIIPQIANNLTKSNRIEIPKQCPVCGGNTVIKHVNDIKSLYCVNPDCQAKHIKSFTHFVSRDAFNIEGLSEATLEKLIDRGFVKEFADIFHLSVYKESIISMEGLGEKSFDNLMAAIHKARNIPPERFIYSLGILNIGLSNAKLICKAFHSDLEKIMEAKPEELVEIQGIGEVIANTFTSYFKEPEHREQIEALLNEVTIIKENGSTNELLFEDKTFVITGSLNNFSGRRELAALIEEKGGRVSGSVSSKTDYLINNDNQSNSSKNKKAIELNIPIITEDDFVKMLT